MEHNDPVFIHPSSFLYRKQPELVVYKEQFKTTRHAFGVIIGYTCEA